MILSTGLYTWFMLLPVEAGKGVLKISQTFVADQEKPCSLAQAFLCFILMAFEDRNRKVPIPASALGVTRIITSLADREKKQKRRTDLIAVRRGRALLGRKEAELLTFYCLWTR